MLKTTSLVIVLALHRAAPGTARLIYGRTYQDHPAADRGEHLVPAADVDPDRRPVLRRALLRPRLVASAAGDSAPDDFRRMLSGPSRSPAPVGRPANPGDDQGAGSDAPPMVRAEGVHKHYGTLQVLKGIDLEVQQGQVFCLVGPSGSGKSTFLRCINHLEKVDSGRLSVDGELVGYRRPATSSTSSGSRRSPPSGPRSAWCSSGSTCSRT